MPCMVFCLVNGEPVQLEVSAETRAILRGVALKTGQPIQNILAPAFKKYGKREGSIVRYIRTDLAKERR